MLFDCCLLLATASIWSDKTLVDCLIRLEFKLCMLSPTPSRNGQQVCCLDSVSGWVVLCLLDDCSSATDRIMAYKCKVPSYLKCFQNHGSSLHLQSLTQVNPYQLGWLLIPTAPTTTWFSNIRTTMSIIESRNSLVAVYAVPAGAIARETKLTANKVLASEIPF